MVVGDDVPVVVVDPARPGARAVGALDPQGHDAGRGAGGDVGDVPSGRVVAPVPTLGAGAGCRPVSVERGRRAPTEQAADEAGDEGDGDGDPDERPPSPGRDEAGRARGRAWSRAGTTGRPGPAAGGGAAGCAAYGPGRGRRGLPDLGRRVGSRGVGGVTGPARTGSAPTGRPPRARHLALGRASPAARRRAGPTGSSRRARARARWSWRRLCRSPTRPTTTGCRSRTWVKDTGAAAAAGRGRGGRRRPGRWRWRGRGAPRRRRVRRSGSRRRRPRARRRPRRPRWPAEALRWQGGAGGGEQPQRVAAARPPRAARGRPPRAVPRASRRRAQVARHRRGPGERAAQPTLLGDVVRAGLAGDEVAVPGPLPVQGSRPAAYSVSRRPGTARASRRSYDPRGGAADDAGPALGRACWWRAAGRGARATRAAGRGRGGCASARCRA